MQIIDRTIAAVTKVLRSLHRRGLKDTLLYIFYEYYFDFKYTVETRKVVRFPAMRDVSRSARVNSTSYQAAPYYFLRRSFAKVALEMEGAGFLDYGCGKGRVMLVAREFGAQVVYGIDFSEQFCAICQQNLSRNRNAQNCWVICQDATNFVIPPIVTVIFFYNPFNHCILAKVTEQIQASLAVYQRKMTIIYHNPIYEQVFHAINFLTVHKLIQGNRDDDNVAILSNQSKLDSEVCTL